MAENTTRVWCLHSAQSWSLDRATKQMYCADCCALIAFDENENAWYFVGVPREAAPHLRLTYHANPAGCPDPSRHGVCPGHEPEELSVPTTKGPLRIKDFALWELREMMGSRPGLNQERWEAALQLLAGAELARRDAESSSRTKRFPRCPDCGSEVRMLPSKGRTRQVLRGIQIAIPGDYELPTCVNCGEYSMSIEESEPLDKLLIDKIRAELARWESEHP